MQPGTNFDAGTNADRQGGVTSEKHFNFQFGSFKSDLSEVSPGRRPNSRIRIEHNQRDGNGQHEDRRPASGDDCVIQPVHYRNQRHHQSDYQREATENVQHAVHSQVDPAEADDRAPYEGKR